MELLVNEQKELRERGGGFTEATSLTDLYKTCLQLPPAGKEHWQKFDC